MSNPHIQGVKVGMTTKDVNDRAKQLSPTGVPGKYVIDALFPCHRTKNDEKKAHQKLKRYQISSEHFGLSSTEAIVKVRSALQSREPAYIREDLREDVAKIIEQNRISTLQKLGKL